jgi:hypothetical protein
MRSVRVLLSCLAALALAGCKTHRLPPLPTQRDPAAAEAPVSPYDPPPDVLTKELSSGKSDGKEDDPHAGHHGHGGGK